MAAGLSEIEIMKEIKRLPLNSKFKIVEETIKAIKNTNTYNQMEAAANILMDDYKNDPELTAFTSIDFDTFYETK